MMHIWHKSLHDFRAITAEFIFDPIDLLRATRA